MRPGKVLWNKRWKGEFCQNNISHISSKFSRYLRSELTNKQDQSSSEVVRTLLGKSPKKEKQVTIPAGVCQISQDGRLTKTGDEVSPTAGEVKMESRDTSRVKENIDICKAQSGNKSEYSTEECGPIESAQETESSKLVDTKQTSPNRLYEPPQVVAGNATDDGSCNGGSPSSTSSIPRIEVCEANQTEGLPPKEQVTPPSAKGPSKSVTSQPAAPSPSRIPSRQPPPSSTQHQQSSTNSSQGHSPVGAGAPGFDLKGGLVGQDELRKLESRLERFVSRSSGSECRCECHFTDN